MNKTWIVPLRILAFRKGDEEIHTNSSKVGRNEISIIKVQMLVCMEYLELKSSAWALGSQISGFQSLSIYYDFGYTIMLNLNLLFVKWFQ